MESLNLIILQKNKNLISSYVHFMRLYIKLLIQTIFEILFIFYSSWKDLMPLQPLRFKL